ncbi:MAG: PD40 domain-containing protein, partial [Anaerolineales bacterium]|nr:PD40 domain-containing protein [Anaerolineales bacterium]
MRWIIRLNVVVMIWVMISLGAQAQDVPSLKVIHTQATYPQNTIPSINSNNAITPKLKTAPNLADKEDVSTINSLIISKLNDPLSYQAHVSDFKISPNGEHVVFIVSQVGDDDGLWSVPLAGSDPIQINGPLAYSDYVISFHISPDSQWVVYTTNYEGDWQIFSVPILGGPVAQLNPQLINGGNVYPNDWEYEISPDSTRVVYVADQDTDEVLELYSVPIIGGMVTKLNDPLIAGGDISRASSSAYWFDISPDSQHVVYSADQEIDNDFELYSVPIGGGTAIKLNSPLATSPISGDVIGDVHTYQISIDGTQVVYIAYLEGDDGIELHLVPITGGVTTSFEGTPTFLGSLDLRISLSSDGSRVIYHPREDQLFSVPLSGQTSIQLNDPILGDVIDFSLTPDSEYVVYTASRSESYEYIRELFSVPIAGGSSLRLHEPFGP